MAIFATTVSNFCYYRLCFCYIHSCLLQQPCFTTFLLQQPCFLLLLETCFATSIHEAMVLQARRRVPAAFLLQLSEFLLRPFTDQLQPRRVLHVPMAGGGGVATASSPSCGRRRRWLAAIRGEAGAARCRLLRGQRPAGASRGAVRRGGGCVGEIFLEGISRRSDGPGWRIGRLVLDRPNGWAGAPAQISAHIKMVFRKAALCELSKFQGKG